MFSKNIPSPKSFGLLGHAPYFLGKDEEGSIRYDGDTKWRSNISGNYYAFRSFENVTPALFGIQ